MVIDYEKLKGTIQCFSPGFTTFPITDEYKENCWPDIEKCARFIPNDGDLTNTRNISTWIEPNATFKCHKNFLRYVFMG